MSDKQHPTGLALERFKANRAAARELAALGVAIFPSTSNKIPLPTIWTRLDTSISDEQKEHESRAYAQEHKGRDPFYIGCTTSIPAINDMWSRSREAVPSISCGPSNVVVVDCDIIREKTDEDIALKRKGTGEIISNGPEQFREFLDSLDIDVSTIPVTTSQSGGEHFYFKNDGSIGNMKLHQFTADIKGQGGQVVAPGAIRSDGKKYSRHPDHISLANAIALDAIPDLPQELSACMSNARLNRLRTSNDHLIAPLMLEASSADLPDYDILRDSALGLDMDEAEDANPALYQLMHENDEIDHSQARWRLAMALLDMFPALSVTDFATLYTNAECSGHFVADETPKEKGQYNWRNVIRDYVRAKTHLTRDLSAFDLPADDEDDIFAPSTSPLPNDFQETEIQKNGTENKPQLPAEKPSADETITVQPPAPFTSKVKTFAPYLGEILLSPLPRIEELVEGILTTGEIILAGGEPGVGKTAGVTALNVCVAAGIPFLGRPVAQGAVIQFGSENIEDDMRRLVATAKRYGAPSSIPLRFCPMRMSFINKVGGSLLRGPTKSEKDVIAFIKLTAEETGQPVKLITIENVRGVITPGHSSDEADATALMDAMRRIRDATGVSILLVHHTTRDGDRYAGSGALGSSADTVLHFSRYEDAAPTKSKKRGEAKANSDFSITFDKLRLGARTQILRYTLGFEVVTKTVADKDIKTVVFIGDKAQAKAPSTTAFGVVDEDETPTKEAVTDREDVSTGSGGANEQVGRHFIDTTVQPDGSLSPIDYRNEGVRQALVDLLGEAADALSTEREPAVEVATLLGSSAVLRQLERQFPRVPLYIRRYIFKDMNETRTDNWTLRITGDRNKPLTIISRKNVSPHRRC